MAKKLPFREGASINMPPLFCGLNYQFWKVRMKIFVESLIKGFGMQFKMALLFLNLKRKVFLSKNLGTNGLMQKIKRPSLIALPRIS